MAHLPEAQELKATVSPNGAIVERNFGLAPFGEYDEDKQLTPEQTLELKNKLRADEMLRARVCATIATELIETLPTHAMTEHGRIRHAGFVAIRWYEDLGRALNLPDADWPEYMTPPATFARAVGQVEKVIQGIEV